MTRTITRLVSYSIDVEEAVNGACSRKMHISIKEVFQNSSYPEVNLACFANDVNGNEMKSCFVMNSANQELEECFQLTPRGQGMALSRLNRLFD